MSKYVTSTGTFYRSERVLPGTDAFRGADFRTEAGLVDQTRLAFCRNMWKDYDAEDVGGIESFPGFRRLCTLLDGGGKAHGLWQFSFPTGINRFIAHIDTKLFIFNEDGSSINVITGIADRDSSAFAFNGNFYLLDGTKYYRIDYSGGSFYPTDLTQGTGYVPITYIDNLEYEQRNMLDNHFYEKWNIPTAEASCAIGNLGLFYSTSGSTITVKGSTSVKKQIYIPSSITLSGTVYDTIDITYDSDDPNRFAGNSNIESVVIEKVHDIGSNAFKGCSRLKRVVIKQITGTISSTAFKNCPLLANIYIDSANNVPAVTLDLGTGYSDPVIHYQENGSVTNPNARYFDCDIIVMGAGQSATAGAPSGYAYDEVLPYDNTSHYLDNYADLGSVTIADGGVIVDSYKPTVASVSARDTVNSYFRTICVVVLSSAGDLVDYDSIFKKTISSYGSSAGNAIFASDGRCDFYISTPCYDGNVSEVKLIGGVFGAKGTTLSTSTKKNGVIYRIVKETISGTDYSSQVQLYAEDLSVLNDTVLQIKGKAVASEFSSSGSADYKSATGYTGTSIQAIQGCTKCCVFDGRPFFTGNPNLPNTTFYASRRSDTGVIDPTYIGVCNFFNDGTGTAKNVAIMGGADTLFVFKEESRVNGSVFYHTPRETGMNFLPKDYPSVEGAKDHDCVGACANFRDDYVFLTRRGLDGVDKAQLNLQRTIGHRSSLVDSIIINKDLGKLQKAQMVEWKGWLCLAIDGEILLADSRQMFQNLDSVEYEWFRLTDVGDYKGDHNVYRYSTGGAIDGHPYIPVTEWTITSCDNPDLIGQKLKVKDVADVCYDYSNAMITKDGAGSTVYTMGMCVSVPVHDYITEISAHGDPTDFNNAVITLKGKSNYAIELEAQNLPTNDIDIDVDCYLLHDYTATPDMWIADTNNPGEYVCNLMTYPFDPKDYSGNNTITSDDPNVTLNSTEYYGFTLRATVLPTTDVHITLKSSLPTDTIRLYAAHWTAVVDGEFAYCYVDNEGYLVVMTDELADGIFSPLRFMLSYKDSLYFITDNGKFYKVNTDKRGYALCEIAEEFPDNEQLYIYENGVYYPLDLGNGIYTYYDREQWINEKVPAYTLKNGIYISYGNVWVCRVFSSIFYCEEPFYAIEPQDIDPYWYSFGQHRYECEIATKYDDCGIPHMSKDTVKNSVVVTCKTFNNSAFEVMAKSERKEWKSNEKVDASQADFTDVDFGIYSFRSRREYIYRSDEHLKKWTRKQYSFKSSVYRNPFGLISVAYGYTIHGKVQF